MAADEHENEKRTTLSVTSEPATNSRHSLAFSGQRPVCTAARGTTTLQRYMSVRSPSIVTVLHHACMIHSKAALPGGGAEAETEAETETETETEPKTETPPTIDRVRTWNYCRMATRQNLAAIPDRYRRVSSINRHTYKGYTRSSRSGSNSSNLLSKICLPASSRPPPPPTMITTKSPLQNSPIAWRHIPHGVIGVVMLLPSFDSHLPRATRG